MLSGISGCTCGGGYSDGCDSSYNRDLEGLASVYSVSSTVCRYGCVVASVTLMSVFLEPKRWA